MKIEISRQNLLEAINKVKSVVPPRSALPILSHLLLEAESDGILRVSATDLKVGIECQTPCTVEEPGSMTVASQRLASITGELPDQAIRIELSDSNVVNLECGRIRTKLYSMAPDEFPPVRKFENVDPLILNQRSLKRLFTKTSFAISKDQARYTLTGLLCEIGNGKVVAVATDSRRMSVCVDEQNVSEELNHSVIIPGKMIQELERLLSDEGEVEVYIDETHAGFAFDSSRLVTALIEGTFPQYDAVVPKRHDKEALIDTGQFLEAVRRTRTMTNDKWNSVRFSLDKGEMTLKVVTPEVGEYQEEISVEYEGEPVEVAFNPDFIIDVVRRIEEEKVSFNVKDSQNPGLIKPHSEADEDNYLNVIMPIRI
ncbi:MAG: DNA polymerase III subunit beta [Candidatus Hydrogenedentota bacterium]